MTLYKIISLEKIETNYGKIEKGAIINTVEFENKLECIKWVNEQYGPYGENIRVKIMEV